MACGHIKTKSFKIDGRWVSYEQEQWGRADDDAMTRKNAFYGLSKELYKAGRHMMWPPTFSVSAGSSDARQHYRVVRLTGEMIED